MTADTFNQIAAVMVTLGLPVGAWLGWRLDRDYVPVASAVFGAFMGAVGAGVLVAILALNLEAFHLWTPQ